MKTTLRARTSDTKASTSAPAAAAGQLMDAHTRSITERRFGFDFSSVRIHADAGAANSAQAVNAAAFTAGDAIVFGRDRYRPGSAEGLRLLSHELTHVVQQRQSGSAHAIPRLSQRDDAPEHEARQTASAFLGGRNLAPLLRHRSRPPGVVPSVQRDEPTATPTAPANVAAPTAAAPLDYDRTPLRLAPVDPKQTPRNLRKLLDDKVTAGDITSYTIVGVPPKKNDVDIFLFDVIRAFGTRDRWGTEADLVTAIGWPAKEGEPTPLGRVTLTISTTGAAQAELISAGAVPQSAQTPVADATKTLMTTYGFSAVKGEGGAAWSDAHLSDVVAALALLPVADRAALKGVELIRVSSLGANAGEFSTGGGVASGATTVTALPSLKLADIAFPPKQQQFFGGAAGSVPAVFQTIVHEVGHAVDNEVTRAASEATSAATIARNVAVVPFNAKVSERKAVFDEYKAEKNKAAKEQLATRLKGMDAGIAPLKQTYDTALQDQATKKKAESATRVSAATIAPLKTDAGTRSALAQTALQTATTAIGKLPDTEKLSAADAMDATTAAGKAITQFVTGVAAEAGTVDALESIVLPFIENRDIARSNLAIAAAAHPALALLATAATAQDVWLEAERAYAHATKRSLRLQKFIDLVTTNKIQRFTQYSKDNWRVKPSEFYAEAYSLWLTDPQFLQTNYKVVFDFFATGEYRK
jgi:hypothetical protein